MKRLLKSCGAAAALTVLAVTLAQAADDPNNSSWTTPAPSSVSGQRTTDVQGTPKSAGETPDNRGITVNGNNNGVADPGFGAPTYGGPALGTPGNGNVGTK
jgi:hypothetical protein